MGIYLAQPENKIDKDGDIFLPETLKKCHGNKVPLTIEFNMNNVVGSCKLHYIKDEGLGVEIDDKLIDKVKGLKPALGFIAKSVEKNIRKDINEIEDIEITSIGCVENHCSDDIKAIKEKKNEIID